MSVISAHGVSNLIIKLPEVHCSQVDVTIYAARTLNIKKHGSGNHLLKSLTDSFSLSLGLSLSRSPVGVVK